MWGSICTYNISNKHIIHDFVLTWFYYFHSEKRLIHKQLSLNQDSRHQSFKCDFTGYIQHPFHFLFRIGGQQPSLRLSSLSSSDGFITSWAILERSAAWRAFHKETNASLRFGWVLSQSLRTWLAVSLLLGGWQLLMVFSTASNWTPSCVPNVLSVNVSVIFLETFKSMMSVSLPSGAWNRFIAGLWESAYL